MVELFNAFMNAWTTLRQMNIYLEIPLAGFAVYWWVYDVLGKESRRVELIPALVCLVGNVAYLLDHAKAQHVKTDLTDAVMVLFMTIFQAGVAHMAYRWAFVRGWIGQDKRKEVKDGETPST